MHQNTVAEAISSPAGQVISGIPARAAHGQNIPPAYRQVQAHQQAGQVLQVEGVAWGAQAQAQWGWAVHPSSHAAVAALGRRRRTLVAGAAAGPTGLLLCQLQQRPGRWLAPQQLLPRVPLLRRRQRRQPRRPAALLQRRRLQRWQQAGRYTGGRLQAESRLPLWLRCKLSHGPLLACGGGCHWRPRAEGKEGREMLRDGGRALLHQRRSERPARPDRHGRQAWLSKPPCRRGFRFRLCRRPCCHRCPFARPRLHCRRRRCHHCQPCCPSRRCRRRGRLPCCCCLLLTPPRVVAIQRRPAAPLGALKLI